MGLCETCLHRAVCGKYKATGGVNKCKDHKEERHGRWISHNRGMNNWVECSECNTVGSPFWKRCPLCEAKMDL